MMGIVVESDEECYECHPFFDLTSSLMIQFDLSFLV